MRALEKDFLPAALEILDKPASPLGRFMIWIVCSFFLIALLWAIFSKVDVVAVGYGKITAIGQTKTVQSFETGVIQEILVANGSRVVAGEVLIKLDPTSSQADVTRLTDELSGLKSKSVRNRWKLSALTNGAGGEFAFDSDVSAPDRQMHVLLANSELKGYLAGRDTLKEKILEKESELRVSKGQITKIDEMLPILKEQVDTLMGLSAEGIASRFQYLGQQERYVSMIRDATIERDRMEQGSAALRSLKKQLEQLEEENRSVIYKELSDIENQVKAVEQDLIKARETHKLLLVRAPVTGVVQQLMTNTIGGVVRSSDILLNLVPEDRKLQAEVKILNKDIGFIKVGQEVEVKLEAFPFTKYGVVHGALESLDHDAIQDENLGLVYPARVSIESETIRASGEVIPLTPGMQLTTEIKLGQRRLIEFILAPIFRYKDESLRER